MRDTRTSCALTSLRSAYAGQKNTSSGILILWIHRDARCSCVQTRACAHSRSLRKGSHTPSSRVEPPFKVTSPENKKTTREGGWMEAEAGIEPANVGFANRCLTTWPLRLDETSSCAAKMLPQSGLVVVAILNLVNCTIVELLLDGVTCQRFIF